MTRNIDDLASSHRDTNRPREALKETFLQSRPQSQWPSYLDELAKDLASGIVIGKTNLDKYNFPREVGPLYNDGILATTDDYSDLPSTLTDVDESDLGRVMFLLNRLTYEVETSNAGLEDINRAVTAVLEKILSDTAEARVRPHLGGESNSTADILMQMLADPDVAGQVETVLERFEDAYHDGLLAKLDTPQMMTPLWEHQREAIREWLRLDSQGYVDMATATGKTVLGLAAIAAHYGSLHPLDSDIDPETQTGDRKSRVLVVAHNDLILEQWRREFDRHLNIPSERTDGSDDVQLKWGRIHFRTAQTLLNQEIIDYDLVILDEAHHYASGTGWGQLLAEFNSRVLALSGSVDSGQDASTVRGRLESNVGPECKRYTLVQAQQDGVIPTFQWSVAYTGVEGRSEEFVEISEKAKAQFRKFQNRVDNDDITIQNDRRFRTFEDIRRYSHTSEGKSLKQSDNQFRDLVTTLFSRRTQRWNQSPEINAVVSTALQHRDRKVVVLTNNNAQVEAIAETLRERQATDEPSVFTVATSQSNREQRDTIDRFDIPGEPAILIGTGDLLGEGVDMQHADVGINMATGSVNKQLIQRIGRVLRNPGTDKRARFVNLVGVPIKNGTQIPAEDGQRLVEDALQFKRFGRSFDNDPVFRLTDGTTPERFDRLLEGGYDRLTTLDRDGLYEWPDDEHERETLEQLLTAVDEKSSPESVLQAWSDDANKEQPTADTTPTDHLVLNVVDEEGSPIADAFVSVTRDTVTKHSRTDSSGRVRFVGVHDDCTAGVRAPDGGVRSIDIESDADQATELTVTVPARGVSRPGVHS